MTLVGRDERNEAAAARGRTVLRKMPSKLVLSVCRAEAMTVRQRGTDAVDGREANAAATAPAKLIVPFVVVGPIGPSLYRCPQLGQYSSEGQWPWSIEMSAAKPQTLLLGHMNATELAKNAKTAKYETRKVDWDGQEPH